MGVMDKFLNYYMNSHSSEEDDFYDDDYDDDEPELPPSRRTPIKEETDDHSTRRSTISAKVTPIRQAGTHKTMSNGMEVCVVRPQNIDEAREITETLLSGRTVVLNLEGLDVDVAQRIVDFTSGSCYAMRGKLQKISHYIFIITPANVDISGDIQIPLNEMGVETPFNTEL